jgi:hypothetical protein
MTSKLSYLDVKNIPDNYGRASMERTKKDALHYAHELREYGRQYGDRFKFKVSKLDPTHWAVYYHKR